jgi:hypothetical protein
MNEQGGGALLAVRRPLDDVERAAADVNAFADCRKSLFDVRGLNGRKRP